MKTKINNFTKLFHNLLAAYPQLAVGASLTLKYPYTAVAAEGGIYVTFRDLPCNDLPAGSLHNVTHEMHALTCLGIIHSRLYEEQRMIPLPSKAQDGEHYAVVPENAALTILIRNWELAKVMFEARNRFDQISHREHSHANSPQ